MKNIVLTTMVILTFLCPLFSQYATVHLDDNKNYFNDGQALTAEKSLMFTGLIPEGMKMLEISVLSYKDDAGQSPLYKAVWQGKGISEMQNFAVPVNYKLRASEKYDFRFDYFRGLDNAEKQQIEQDIRANVEAYLAAVAEGEKNIKLDKSPRKIVEGLNDILERLLQYYRPADLKTRVEFSEIVLLKIKRLEDANLAQSYSKKDSTMSIAEYRENTRAELIEDLHEQLDREVARILSPEWLVLSKTRLVDNYETEGKQNALSVSFGYGGAYLSGKFSENFDYGSSPYLGLSVPLGNSAFAPKALSNASFTLGAFTKNFTDNQGKEITGVLFNRPWYAGLDYKLFQFIRFNAGATFLQEIGTDGSKGSVAVRPFVGVGARINLNFSLEK